MTNLIILIGQRVRSGSNFVGSTLKMHPDVITLPENTSLGEFNLFKSSNDPFKLFKSVSKESFGMNFNGEDIEKWYSDYGKMWLGILIDKFKIQEDKIIFLKTCDSNHINLWTKTFPNARIVVLTRDGRDNVISSVKASNDKRNWHTLWIRLKKRLNYYSGRSFINHTIDWKKTAHHIIEIKETENLRVFKYEDLNNNIEGLKQLLDFYGLHATNDIIEKCISAPVIGSSFGINKKSESKPNWSPMANKSNFVFSEKWKRWGVIKKRVFNYIAGKELKELGY